MKSTVQNLVDTWSGAFNAGHIDEMIALYAPDVRLLPPGRPKLVNLQATRDYFLAVRAQGFHDYAIRIDDVLTAEGTVVATGRWGITGPGPDGGERRYDGNWLIGLAEADLGKIVVQMWN